MLRSRSAAPGRGRAGSTRSSALPSPCAGTVAAATEGVREASSACPPLPPPSHRGGQVGGAGAAPCVCRAKAAQLAACSVAGGGGGLQSESDAAFWLFLKVFLMAAKGVFAKLGCTCPGQGSQGACEALWGAEGSWPCGLAQAYTVHKIQGV